MTRTAAVAVLLALAAGVAVRPATAPACMAVPRPGERVDIGEEAALIVWDPATKTEHFIRRGSFRTAAADFGFLVPTPSRPELAEADPHLFDRLAQLTAPKVEYRTVPRPRRGDKMMVGSAAPASKAGAVAVLEEKKVGGYDATVIAFRRGEGEGVEAGAAELGKWLKERGYEFGPPLIDWLKPYVEKGWVLTAFKVSAGKGGAALKPVRMSFQTDRPFYPYREPTTQRTPEPAAGRLLRVFFLSPVGKMAGALGADAGGWPGRVVWADKLPVGLVAGLAHSGPVFNDADRPAWLPAGEGWLTEFEDRSSPRPGTDEVYFAPAADQSVVHRPPRVVEVYGGPADEGGGPAADDDGPVAALGGRWVLVGGAVAGGALLVLALLYAIRVGGRG